MNDQDPLAQLRDIHMPDSVGLWPPAPGWWALAFLIVATLVFFAVKYWQHKRQNRYRLEAHTALQTAWNIYTKDSDAKNYLLQLTQILKRTALSAYPTVAVNSFHGQVWLAFLDDSNQSAAMDFSDGPGKILLTLPYQPDIQSVDLQPLHQLCLQWLLHHRPQKELVKSSFKPKSRHKQLLSNETVSNATTDSERGPKHAAV